MPRIQAKMENREHSLLSLPSKKFTHSDIERCKLSVTRSFSRLALNS